MSEYLLSRLDLPGLSYCQMRRSARARRMRIEVRPDCSLLLVVPDDSREDQWLAFVLSRRRWIHRVLRDMQDRYPGYADQREILPATLYLPFSHEQFILRQSPGKRNAIRRHDDELQLSTVDGTGETARQVLREWLRKRARELLGRRLEQLSAHTGLHYRRLTIRGQKTRWGSCSAAASINLNYKLLFLEPALVDHVLLHELAHTRHLDHSPRFWSLLRRHDPDCDANRRALRDAGRGLPTWLAGL